MRHPTRKAIDKFNKILNLNEKPDMQDWEIECADPSRVKEFIECYNSETENDDERFTLMAIILGSFEEYHGTTPPSDETWQMIKKILTKDILIHKDHIEYYQFPDAKNEDEMFPISHLMRQLI